MGKIRSYECDQIWRNFATFSKISNLCQIFDSLFLNCLLWQTWYIIVLFFIGANDPITKMIWPSGHTGSYKVQLPVEKMSVWRLLLLDEKDKSIFRRKSPEIQLSIVGNRSSSLFRELLMDRDSFLSENLYGMLISGNGTIFLFANQFFGN